MLEKKTATAPNKPFANMMRIKHPNKIVEGLFREFGLVIRNGRNLTFLIESQKLKLINISQEFLKQTKKKLVQFNIILNIYRKNMLNL